MVYMEGVPRETIPQVIPEAEDTKIPTGEQVAEAMRNYYRKIPHELEGAKARGFDPETMEIPFEATDLVLSLVYGFGSVPDEVLMQKVQIWDKKSATLGATGVFINNAIGNMVAGPYGWLGMSSSIGEGRLKKIKRDAITGFEKYLS